MPKHLEINNYTPTAPRTRQPSASSPITPLASTSSMTSSNTSANRCCGKLLACHHAISTPRFPRAANADRILPITYSACALTIVAVMVCRAYCKVDRIDVPHCPNAIVSSFEKALTKNSSKPLLMPPELINVHGTNAMFCSAHNLPTAPLNLMRSRLPTGSTKIRSVSSAPAANASASEILCWSV